MGVNLCEYRLWADKKQSEESGCDRLKRTLHFGMKMTDEVKFIFCVEYNGLLTLLLLPVCLD